MAINSKMVNVLVAKQATLYIVPDHAGNKPVLIRFEGRDRGYVEYTEIVSGHSGKMHRQDITLWTGENHNP